MAKNKDKLPVEAEQTAPAAVDEATVAARRQQIDDINRQAGIPMPGAEGGMTAPGGAPSPVDNGKMQERMAQIDAINRQANITPEQMLGNFVQREQIQAQRPKVITKEKVAEAAALLEDYRKGKENLELRIVDNEIWYRQQHWHMTHKDDKTYIPSSGWVFNSLANKHADLMDNYPECTCLPQEPSDDEAAKVLTSIIPVVLTRNKFKRTFSDESWAKIKTGTGVFGVFWNPTKDNGLGDIDIKHIDILSLFWEPGITDIQKSQNVFTVELWNNDVLRQQYPNELSETTLSTPSIDVAKYIYDDDIDTSNKSAVVDWYYKKNIGGKNLLCYVKFVNDTVLYSSEDDINLAGEDGEVAKGYYDHGLYPFVPDVLYPEVGTFAGFGLIDVMKDNASTIDRLNAAIVRNAEMGSMRRFFVRNGAAINEEEFRDWTNPLIHVTDGNLGQDQMREYQPVPLSGAYLQVRQSAIDELKETSGNRDFAQGSTSAGVTSGAAISALQEAGSKLSRDIIQKGYEAFTDVCRLVIELMRQFYDQPRMFRVIGDKGQQEFVQFDNRQIAGQQQQGPGGMDLGMRVPDFDIDIRAHKSNPFNRVAANQDAVNYYQMGFFAPQNADMSLAALEMMDFEGKDKMREIISRNGGMYRQIQQLQQVVAAMAQTIDNQNGTSFSQGIVNDGYMDYEEQMASGKSRRLAQTGNEAPTNAAARQRTAAHTEV